MTRFELSNVTAPYDPPIIAVTDAGGTWDQAATGITKLSQIQEGVSASSTLSVGSTTANWDKLHRRFITDPITDTGTINGTARWAIKYYEDNAGLNAFPHVHIWVTQGDSNAKRGHLIVDNIGGTELGTATSPPTIDSGAITVNPVNVVAGDRIVLEIGYRASSALTTYLAALFRGGTGTDAVAGDTTNTRPTWLDLSGLTGLTPNIVGAYQGEALLAGASASDVAGAVVGQGDASHAGIGALEGTGAALSRGDASLGSASALEATGTPLSLGEAVFAGGSASVATGVAVGAGASNLAGVSALDPVGESGPVAELIAGSALVVSGAPVTQGQATLAGGSAVAATAQLIGQGSVTVAGASALEVTGVALPVPAFYGDLSLIEFYALTSTGAVQLPLPDVLSFTLSPLLNDAGSLSIDYPVTGANFSILHENVTSDTDLFVAIHFNGQVQPQLQAILNESSGDDVEEGSVWTFSGNFNIWRMTEAVVAPKAGMPTQGEDDPAENDAHFYSLTAGQIMRTLLQEAVNRGALTDITWSSIGNTTDSNGVAWSKIITLKVAPGTDYLQMLLALAEYGMAEFEMRASTLRMYEFGTFGADRTVQSPPLVFRAGQSVLDSPRKHSLRDTATALLVAGGSGLYHEESDATALTRRGRRVEAFSSQGSIHDAGTLTAYTQARLGTLVQGKMEKTHGLSFYDGPQPVRDFGPGDWALSDLGDGLERLRVKQWTLSQDESGMLTGSVVLNDLFAEAQAAMTRRLQGIEGGSTVTGTSQTRAVVSGNDNTIPVAPSGLTVSSLAYLTDGGQVRTAATAQWDPVTVNTDGTSIDDIDLYLVAWRYSDTSLYTNPNAANWAYLPARQNAGDLHHVSWSGLEPGKAIEVRLQVKDNAGHYSAPSASVFHTLASDVTPPPTPSTPVTSTQFGSVRIEWNGLGSVGQPMPDDFARVEIHVSLVSGFTPSATTYWNHFTGKAATAYSNIAYDTTIFIRFVAVDISGNPSAASAQASGTARQAVSADVFDGAIGSSKLADLAVVRAKIADLAVNNAKIADLAVGKLVTGTLTADLILGANVATALTGARVGLNQQGFYAFSAANVQTVGINNDGSAYFLGEVATAASGARFIFNPGGTNPTELRVMPNTGTDNYTRLTAGTVTDGLGGAHSILTIRGDRYANDIGEPYLEMFGSRATLGWGDTALPAVDHLARYAVDRFGPTISGSVIKLRCEDRTVTNPDNYLSLTFAGGGYVEMYNNRTKFGWIGNNDIEIRKSLIAGLEDTCELFRGTASGMLFHNTGISSRNRSDTSDNQFWGTAFNTTSSVTVKRDFRLIPDAVLTKLRAAPVSMWRYTADVAERGADAPFHLGPMAEDMPPELVGIGPEGTPYTKVSSLVAALMHDLQALRTEHAAVASRVGSLERRPA